MRLHFIKRRPIKTNKKKDDKGAGNPRSTQQVKNVKVMAAQQMAQTGIEFHMKASTTAQVE